MNSGTGPCMVQQGFWAQDLRLHVYQQCMADMMATTWNHAALHVASAAWLQQAPVRLCSHDSALSGLLRGLATHLQRLPAKHRCQEEAIWLESHPALGHGALQGAGRQL
jgi:hypothetical protein